MINKNQRMLKPCNTCNKMKPCPYTPPLPQNPTKLTPEQCYKTSRIARLTPRIAKLSWKREKKIQIVSGLLSAFKSSIGFYSYTGIKRMLHLIRSHKISIGDGLPNGGHPYETETSLTTPQPGPARGAQ